jgi:hypothetical protein
MIIIPAFGRLTQKDQEMQTSPHYIGITYL